MKTTITTAIPKTARNSKANHGLTPPALPRCLMSSAIPVNPAKESSIQKVPRRRSIRAVGLGLGLGGSPGGGGNESDSSGITEKAGGLENKKGDPKAAF
jgi:hypothetical protein